MSDRSLIDELTAGLSEALRDEYEERAGILEFDGGMPRECAEFAAVALIYRRNALEAMGLCLVRLQDGTHALSESWSVGIPNTCELSLACVVRAMGGLAVLTPPKSEENGVSEVEES